MNPDSNVAKDDEDTGVIVAGTEAHEARGQAERPEADHKRVGAGPNAVGTEISGPIVAGREAHEAEAKPSRRQPDATGRGRPRRTGR